MQMRNLGLFKGYPTDSLTPEQRSALFEENQRNHPLTRQTEADRILTESRQPQEKSTQKKPG